jgi:hypothetical protein
LAITAQPSTPVAADLGDVMIGEGNEGSRRVTRVDAHVTRVESGFRQASMRGLFGPGALAAWWGTRGRLDDPTPKARYMQTWPESVKAGGGLHSREFADRAATSTPGCARLPLSR